MQTNLQYKKDHALPLLEEVMNRSSQNLLACYQCRRCAAGCPVADQTGITPDQLIRRIILGDRKGSLENPLVWQCVSCYTCGTRCPNKIQTARITETLKKMATEEHLDTPMPKIKAFHDSFCKSAKHFGRVNEIELMGLYQLKNTVQDVKKFRFAEISREYKRQMALGIKMMKKKRMHFGLERIKGMDELRRLYENADARRKGPTNE